MTRKKQQRLLLIGSALAVLGVAVGEHFIQVLRQAAPARAEGAK